MADSFSHALPLADYPIGLSSDSSRAGYHFAFVLLLEIYSVTLGQAFAALSPTEYIAEQMVPGALLIFVTFCGASLSLSPSLAARRRTRH